MNALHEVKKMLENKVEPEAILAWINSTGEPSGGKSAEKLINELEIEFDEYTGKGLITKYELIDFASQYAHQQPVQGYSKEQVNEAMDKIETMEALENTMKPQYQQPVNDGWRVYNTGVDITEQCTFEDGVITINREPKQEVNDGWVRVKERIKALENWKPKKQ